MKTTIELSDDLLARARKVMQREHVTLKSLIEAGLTVALQQREGEPVVRIDPVVMGGSGIQEEFAAARWDQIRDAAYGVPTR